MVEITAGSTPAREDAARDRCEQKSDVGMARAAPLVQPVTFPSTVVSLNKEDLKKAMGPLLKQITELVDPSCLMAVLNDERQAVKETEYASEKGEEKEEEYRKTEGADEHLMPLLLPSEDQSLTPKRKMTGAVIANKRI